MRDNLIVRWVIKVITDAIWRVGDKLMWLEVPGVTPMTFPPNWPYEEYELTWRQNLQDNVRWVGYKLKQLSIKYI